MSASNACLKPSISGAQRADMATSEEQRASFHNVRKHHRVSVAELVESGFFKPDDIPDCAEANAVVCYYCGVILDRWRESDSVQSICVKREQARVGVVLTHFTCVERRHQNRAQWAFSDDFRGKRPGDFAPSCREARSRRGSKQMLVPVLLMRLRVW